MKIRDVAPGTEVRIKGGPADGRVVKVIMKSGLGGTVGVMADGHSSAVRSDLEVEPT